MDKTLRSILWVLVALVILSSFSTGWFFMAKERLYDEYLDLENLFKTTMERMNRELDASNKQNRELRTKLDTVTQEIDILESKNETLSSQYEEVLKEKDDLNRELAMVKKGKFFLEKKLMDMESDRFLAGLYREKISLEVELKRLKDEVVPKELELEQLKRENMALQQRLKDSSEVTQLLSRDLLKEKEKAEESRILKAKLAELEKVAGVFNKVLAEKETLQVKVSGIERELEQKDQEIDRLKFALGQITKDREVRAEAYHSPSEVELPPIVVHGGEYGTSGVAASYLGQVKRAQTLEGKIVTVNREHDFVVIDLGGRDMVDVGSKFNVYRDGLLIGSLEVIQVRESIAACDIKDLKPGFTIEIDDTIIKR